MSPEAQRIAIAEACGWKWTYKSGAWHHARLTSPDGSIPVQSGFGGKPSKKKIESRLAEWPVNHLPNYLKDLNAIHGAVKSLDPETYSRFCGYLIRMFGKEELLPYLSLEDSMAARAMSAEAGQIAEAFLRVLGKWDDSK